MNAITTFRVIRETAVLDKTGIASHQHLYQLIAAKKFPSPIHLASRATGWIEHEVDAWIRARIAERDGESPADEAAA
jgi:prophage regulatory protein